jgi:Paraquat-inducible protein A
MAPNHREVTSPTSILSTTTVTNGRVNAREEDDNDDNIHRTSRNSLTEPLLPMDDSSNEGRVVGSDVTPVPTSSTATATHENDPSSERIAEQLQLQQQQQQATNQSHELILSSNASTSTSSTRGSFWRRCCRSRSSTASKTILAFASTTNCIATLLIPLFICATHLLFIYGQTCDMWSLLLHTDINVQYTATTYESRITLDAFKLPRSDQFNIPNQSHTVRTFTYVYAMQELWKAKHMPGVFLPRLASAGLFLFSGVWPHLKLLLLNVTWFTPYTNPKRRQRILSYLSVLGKWSLVDVLVVCVMVGVLHLHYTFTSQHVMDMIGSHLQNVVTLVHTVYDADQLCSMALKYSCDNPKKIDRIINCQTCRTTINTWFHHPDAIQDIIKGIDTNGGGQVQLSVVGLNGIYAFCGAVIVSILLSFIVDYYDYQCRNASDPSTETNIVPRSIEPDNDSVENQNITNEEPLPSAVRTNLVDDDGEDSILNQLLLAAENGGRLPGRSHPHNVTSIDTRSIADRDFDRRIRIENSRSSHIVWQVLSFMTMIVVVCATFAVTMERRVYGAIPMLLQDTLDVVWTEQYNLVWLAYTTALAGKWDYLLMGTFVWFIIAGPILRALLCVIANRYNETSTMSNTAIVALYRTKRHLSTWIDFIGAFCAWEVFTVAVLMVDLLMPAITSTILIDPRCAQIVSTNTTGIDSRNLNCFEMEFNILKHTFWMVVTGGVILLLISQNVRNNLQITDR